MTKTMLTELCEEVRLHNSVSDKTEAAKLVVIGLPGYLKFGVESRKGLTFFPTIQQAVVYMGQIASETCSQITSQTRSDVGDESASMFATLTGALFEGDANSANGEPGSQSKVATVSIKTETSQPPKEGTLSAFLASRNSSSQPKLENRSNA